jgi:hypothetical protein
MQCGSQCVMMCVLLMPTPSLSDPPPSIRCACACGPPAAQANRAGLTLTLIGGAVDGGVSGDSTSACLSLLRERDAWLFDVGEDTQRQLMWTDHIRPSKVRGWGGVGLCCLHCLQAAGTAHKMAMLLTELLKAMRLHECVMKVPGSPVAHLDGTQAL